MPKAFTDAVAAGAKVRTVTGPDPKFGLGQGEYMHVAFHKGAMIKGEKKSNKEKLDALEDASKKHKKESKADKAEDRKGG